jgi:imidazolonepropionase-like amidohydrolase
LTPGASLHHELEHLVEADIPQLEVIKIVIKNGAQALGIQDKLSTTEAVKEAGYFPISLNS